MSARLTGIDCVSYVRVSTEQQTGEARTSLGDQDRATDALAATLGRVIGARYRDEGASGATAEQRPAFMQLLADCAASPRRPSKLGYVLVLNDSRWGRFPDPEESTYWRMHLKKLGWVVRFAENDDSQNLMVRTVMRAIVGSQATQKREDVRANAKRGSRGAAALGYWATRAPYGYLRKVVYPAGRDRVLVAGQRKAIDEKVTLTPDADAAAVVRELFIRYASGTESLASVTAWLREIAPARKWTRPAVRFTLSNPAYVGDVVSGRVSSDKAERAETPRRPEAEWVTHRDAHPAIVSRALFAAVQDVLARNQKWTSRVRTDWLLSGVVRCPCGQPLVSGGPGKAGTPAAAGAYRCVTKSGIVADRCAVRGAVKKEWLEATVIDTLAGFIRTPAHRKRLRMHLDRALAALREAPTVTAESIARELATAIATRDRLVAAVAGGILEGDEAKLQLAVVRRQIARLESQRDAITTDTKSQHLLDAERDRIESLAMDFPRLAAGLHGPALRELIRPWIAGATFDPATRTLTLDINHVPTFTHGVLEQMPRRPSQETARPGVTRRKVVVGGRR